MGLTSDCVKSVGKGWKRFRAFPAALVSFAVAVLLTGRPLEVRSLLTASEMADVVGHQPGTSPNNCIESYRSLVTDCGNAGGSSCSYGGTCRTSCSPIQRWKRIPIGTTQSDIWEQAGVVCGQVGSIYHVVQCSPAGSPCPSPPAPGSIISTWPCNAYPLDSPYVHINCNDQPIHW